MPAIPFFVSMPSQSTATPSGGALASSPQAEAPSSLTSSMEGTASAVLAPSEQQGGASSDSMDQGLSFWQTLQQTTEMSDLPDGQNFAALSTPGEQLETLAKDTEAMTDLLPALTADTIQIDVSEPTTALVNPLGIPQVDTAKVQLSQDEVSMEYIESQRAATPSYHMMNRSADVKQVVTGSQTMLAAQEQPALQAQAAVQTFDMNKTQQQQLAGHPILDELSTMPDGEAEALTDGLSLKEFSIDEKSTNIHEKPLTLQQKTEVETKSQAPQLVDAVQGAKGDGDESTIVSNLTSKSVSATSSKVVADSTMVTEKPSSHFKMDVPPQSPQWSEQIARRITIMSSEQIQSARIQLDPPELGLLEIKIKVQQDQVNVAFASGHQTVRDALETQAPRLKELMEQQGVDLTDVNVSDHGRQSSDGGAEEGLANQGDGQAGDWQDEEELNTQETISLQSDSLVDDFA